jgi:hypothetical protein
VQPTAAAESTPPANAAGPTIAAPNVGLAPTGDEPAVVQAESAQSREVQGEVSGSVAGAQAITPPDTGTGGDSRSAPRPWVLIVLATAASALSAGAIALRKPVRS